MERARFEAERAARQFDACEPENRLVARPLERKLGDALAGVQREQRKLAALELARPAPLSDHERRMLGRLARDLPKLRGAKTTSDRDRKELLRTLISEIVVTIARPENIARIEIFWESGARSELSLRLLRRGGERQRTDEDTIELIARLAVQHPDHQIAGTLNKQGHRTGTGLPFTATRVKYLRHRNGIPDAPPPNPDSETVTIKQAATELGVCHTKIYRWPRGGLLPGEQVTPDPPWRVRLTDEVRSRFVPDVPDGYLPLDGAAKRLG